MKTSIVFQYFRDNLRLAGLFGCSFFASRMFCASSRTVKTSSRRFANRFCSSHYCLSHCMGCRKEHLRMFSLASPSVLCVCCEGAPVSFFLSLFLIFSLVSFSFPCRVFARRTAKMQRRSEKDPAGGGYLHHRSQLEIKSLMFYGIDGLILLPSRSESDCI